MMLYYNDLTRLMQLEPAVVYVVYLFLDACEFLIGIYNTHSLLSVRDVKKIMLVRILYFTNKPQD